MANYITFDTIGGKSYTVETFEDTDMETITLDFATIAGRAGFQPEHDGRLNLPPTQLSADALCHAALSLLPQWAPGSPAIAVTLTGAGPVWGHLAIAHAPHGRAARLSYVAPNTPDPIVIFNHGTQP